MGFTKFPSIESFAHVWRDMDRKFVPEMVTYRGKVKLHGTNGGVRVYGDGTVVAQSRSRDISVDNDNMGFAAWVAESAPAWADAHPGNADSPSIIYYGEWAGKGIQSKDAVTLLDAKYFFVFAMDIDGVFVTDPDAISRYIPDLDRVLVIPWQTSEIEIDFANSDQANKVVEQINDMVEEIGGRDPFIYDIFGVDGVGEGLVMMPTRQLMTRDVFSNLSFKAKSEAHRVKKTKKAASRNVELPEGVHDFVEMFVTDARCHQALMEACDGIPEKERTAEFLKWIGGDVKKESVAELDDMGLEWSQVSKHVNKAAVRWFMQRCENPLVSA